MSENIQVIKLNPDLMDHAEKGSKRKTIRKGIKTKYHLGPVYFQNSEDEKDKLFINATIVKIEQINLSNLGKNYKKVLEDIYGKMEEFELLTLIEWDY